MVSHDREFLNSITTDIIHLHDERLHYYRGNFAQVGGWAARGLGWGVWCGPGSAVKCGPVWRQGNDDRLRYYCGKFAQVWASGT